jgi:hypothetical protein
MRTQRVWILALATLAAWPATAPLVAQQEPLPPGAVPAGKGNPYQRARQLPARLLSFTAEPASVQPGAPVTLEWATENPTGIVIEPGLGRVSARGSRQVFPSATTKYTLTVKGANDQVLTQSVTVTVSGEAVSSAPASGPAPKTPDLSGVYDFGAFGPRNAGPNTPAAPVLKAGAEKFKVTRGPNDAGLTADCMPLAGPQAFSVPYQFQIVQSSQWVALMHEYPGTFRIIPTTAGAHQKDLDPTWMGDSVGHWEGDTLVIDTIGFNDKTEIAGFRHTEDLHIVERIRADAAGALHYEATLEDPNVFEKPWKLERVFPRRPDLAKINEFVCENNHDYSGLFKK